MEMLNVSMAASLDMSDGLLCVGATSGILVNDGVSCSSLDTLVCEDRSEKEAEGQCVGEQREDEDTAWDGARVRELLEEVSERDTLGVSEVELVVEQVLTFVNALLFKLHNMRRHVRHDMWSNADKIRDACTACGADSVHDMVAWELEHNIPWSNSGREGLLWLKRSLSFIRRVMVNEYLQPELPTPRNVRDAYNDRLACCHDW
eukprot:CAMPEP_0184682734 /NCGR_PEP_ID=MMETSP0312-20130426/8575_1 /TAXON_ID=31354 /ORGANISM="Compsopogon coeruleus, Strain SAG 36.94" /LENGTH=203 /DNA_ID=CAMNT_0027134597 /DNA_START=249 /DNA_END=857 /DNA_ORIENTATION=-